MGHDDKRQSADFRHVTLVLAVDIMISQLPSAPQKSMTYQTGIKFNEELISGTRLRMGPKFHHVFQPTVIYASDDLPCP